MINQEQDQSSSEDNEQEKDREKPTLTQQFSGHVVDQCSPVEDDPALWPEQLSDSECSSIVQ